MPAYEEFLLNFEIFDIQRQYFPLPEKDLRLYRQIRAVQPDIQMEGVIVIAVVNAQANIFPAGSRGGEIAGAQGFQQQPGGAHRRDLVVGQQGKVEGHIIKGQGAVLPVYRALDPGDAVGFRDGKPDIALFVCLALEGKDMSLVPVVRGDLDVKAAALAAQKPGTELDALFQRPVCPGAAGKKCDRQQRCRQNFQCFQSDPALFQ